MHALRRFSPVACLLIVSWAASASAAPFKSAEVISRETQKYGAVEARVRAAQGSGFITALFFWRSGSEANLDNWQEQDFEIFGRDGTYQTQIMTPGRKQHQRFFSLFTPAYENYYTYRLEWTPEYLAFLVDGHLVRLETDPVEYQKLLDPNLAEAAEVRLSLWGDNEETWSGAFDDSSIPAAAYFDYCALYAYTPGAGPGGTDFTLRWRDDFNSLSTSRWWFANWGWDRASDYVPQNARSIDGKLVLVLTSESATGVFPSNIPADNPVLPPVGSANIPDPATVQPFVIPIRLEAEIVSAYSDTTPGNLGDPECSVTDIDAQRSNDSGGGCNVAYTRNGEWLEYPFFTPEAGTFNFVLRVATDKAFTASTIRMDIDGVAVSGILSVPPLGWQSYSNLSVPVAVTPGRHTLRLNIVQGPLNINYIDVLDSSTPPPPPPPGSIPDPSTVQPFPVPARLEAEVVSAYSDTTPGNLGDAECSVSDVDAQKTRDTGGGCNVAYTRDGEWLEYPIAVDAPGSYDFVLRVATDTRNAASRLRVEVDGFDVSGLVSVPNLGWQTFSDVTVPVDLQSGTHLVRVMITSGPLNFNYIDVLESSVEPPTGSCDLSRTRYEAETLQGSTGAVQGNLYNLWSNGTLTGGHAFEGGDTIISVVAQGQPALGIWPHMVVRVGGGVVGDVYVDSSSPQTYEFFVDTAASSQSISVEFDNDYYQSGGEDRNLLVDALIVDDCP